GEELRCGEVGLRLFVLFQAEDGIRDRNVTGVQTCALPISSRLYTLLLQKRGMKGVFSVGRVQTATLYLLYKRQQEIEEFVSRPYFTFQGEATINNESFDVKHKQ